MNLCAQKPVGTVVSSGLLWWRKKTSSHRMCVVKIWKPFKRRYLSIFTISLSSSHFDWDFPRATLNFWRLNKQKGQWPVSSEIQRRAHYCHLDRVSWWFWQLYWGLAGWLLLPWLMFNYCWVERWPVLISNLWSSSLANIFSRTNAPSATSVE